MVKFVFAYEVRRSCHFPLKSRQKPPLDRSGETLLSLVEVTFILKHRIQFLVLFERFSSCWWLRSNARHLELKEMSKKTLVSLWRDGGQAPCTCDWNAYIPVLFPMKCTNSQLFRCHPWTSLRSDQIVYKLFLEKSIKAFLKRPTEKKLKERSWGSQNKG